MSNVLSLARRLARLGPQERRLVGSVANELAGDGKRRKRRNGRRKVAAVARTSKPRTKAPAKAVAPKAAAPRARPRSIPAFEEED